MAEEVTLGWLQQRSKNWEKPRENWSAIVTLCTTIDHLNLDRMSCWAPNALHYEILMNWVTNWLDLSVLINRWARLHIVLSCCRPCWFCILCSMSLGLKNTWLLVAMVWIWVLDLDLSSLKTEKKHEVDHILRTRGRGPWQRFLVGFSWWDDSEAQWMSQS